MIRACSLLILLCCILVKTTGQTVLPVFEIKPGMEEQGFIQIDNSYWQLLADSTGGLTINDVSNLPVSAGFHINEGPLKNVNTYWLRYQLKNTTGHDLKIVLASAANYSDLYVSAEGNEWMHSITGDLVPWSKKDGYKSFSGLPLSIKDGIVVWVYKRNQYDYKFASPTGFTTGFYFEEKFVQENYVNNTKQYVYTVINAVLFGIFLLGAIINLFFYRVVKERVYIYYALVLIAAGISTFRSQLFAFFFKEYPVAYYYGLIALVAFLPFLVTNNFRYFFKTFADYPRWDKFLLFLSVICGLGFVLVFAANVNNVIIDWAAAVVFIGLLITCLLYIKSNDNTARLLITGALPVLIISGLLKLVVLIFNYLDSNPPIIQWLNTWGSYIELTTQFWLVCIMSWALFKRYQGLQQQIVLESLEKERMAKEREIERNQLIAQQKIELENKVTQRTQELQQSLKELQSAQAQLIQAEKMASLGELTAGIAHEIQNPLNFVNNFSEVSRELIEELKTQKTQLNNEEQDELLNDIDSNLEKINHHGKRADAIVKGMLQHSRNSSGQKDMVDINALCDEYLRLAYHGLRAKDKDFNAVLQTDFDSSIGSVSIIAEDIGRVLLNLFNNGFYAVNEKKKQAEAGYQPTIKVATTHLDNKVKITVTDNGNGVPEKIRDKIFQPFFTTKPTGQGTGLGLSLSYDIVKAHGGEMKVDTKEGEYSTFTVLLPLNNG
ncbi:MAG: ATP-binding protein [Chitinophagaceae bacterium]